MGEDEEDEFMLEQMLGLSGGAKAMKKKAMKKKAMKKLKAFTQKRYAFTGKLSKTASGLTKADLVKNKHGKVVSKKMSLRGSKSPWIAAVQKARAALKIKGFSAIKKGSPLYTKAKEFYK